MERPIWYKFNFLETLEDLQIKNMVDFPNYVNNNEYKYNKLELIFTSKPELKSLPPLCDLCRYHVVLDFKFVVANFEENKFNHEKLSYRSAKLACFESISKEINQIDCDECYESFVRIYDKVCKKYIRKRRSTRGRRNNYFMNPEIRDLIRNKRKICRKRRNIGFNIKEYRRKCRKL